MKQSYLILKKHWLTIICTIIFSQSTQAQTFSTKNIIENTSIGFMPGLSFPSMHYSDNELNEYGNSLMMRGVLVFFAEVNLNENIAVRPEFKFFGRGQNINDTNITYQLKANYFDLSLPFLYRYNINEFTPYAMLAPYIGIATGGDIWLNNYTSYITTATLAPVDLGVNIGGGVQKEITFANIDLIAGVELAYNVGLTNTFSKQERNETAYAENMSVYTIEGSRKNRGLSIMASIAIPIKNISNIFSKNESNEGPIVNIKEYYTVDEINRMVDEGRDVTNKKIKMNSLNFEFGKSTLDKKSKQYLGKIITLLTKNSSMKMNISGHTDNVGTDKYNLDLSQKRAEAVYEYLISQYISADRISYDFYGASKPITDNDTEEHRAENRRVEFKIIK